MGETEVECLERLRDILDSVEVPVSVYDPVIYTDSRGKSWVYSIKLREESETDAI